MGEKSEIQWTQATQNFWTGCIKVSAGCKFCYMYRDKERYGLDPRAVVRTAPKTFNAPLYWKEPKLIFTCSWSDFFIEQADEWRADAWDIIRKTPQHTWQILTKRPERIAECLPDDWGEGYKNVWLGVTVEETSALERVKILSDIPAQVRFVSFEPLIERIDMTSTHVRMLFARIDWAIIGGESGNDTGAYRYRPCELEWIEHLERNLPRKVAVFVKQTGTYLAKKLSLRDRHGGDIEEWPESIRTREMPANYKTQQEVK